MIKGLNKVLLFFLTICIMPIGLLNVRAEGLNDTIINKNLDVNKDFVVDIKDLAGVAQGYNMNSKASGWQEKYDLNYDGIIDIYDLTMISKFLNSTIENIEPTHNANINNYGFTTYDGTWVYYGNPVNEEKLSRAKIDGSDVEKICEDKPLFINVNGEYIYYCNSSDNNSIYKIKKDGTGRTRLTSDNTAFVRVYNNSIYYQNINENYSLYRMNLDGSNKVKISDEMPMYINFYGKYMYYSNFSNNGEIIRVDLGNFSKITLNSTPSEWLTMQDDYIFYKDYNSNQIYRMNKDGTNITYVISEPCNQLNAVNGWVYYTNYEDKLYRVKYDGSTFEKLTDFSISYFNITGDRIFFYDENGYLRSTKLDGTDMKYFGICRTILNIHSLYNQIGQGDYYEFPKYAALIWLMAQS